MKRRRKRKNKQLKIITISMIFISLLMITGYSAFSTTLNLTAKGNIIEKSRTLKNWTETSNEDFHTDFYREHIITATFLDTAEIPNNAHESWDVSTDKKKGVVAYVTESQSETGKYDLFIGANKGVIANENSSNLFYGFLNLTSINFNTNYDTSNTINMSNMFINSTISSVTTREC